MSDHDFYIPDDIDVLRMENELLSFENSYLKAKLAEQRRSAGTAEVPSRRGGGRGTRARIRRAWRRLESLPGGAVAVKVRRSPRVRALIARPGPRSSR